MSKWCLALLYALHTHNDRAVGQVTDGGIPGFCALGAVTIFGTTSGEPCCDTLSDLVRAHQMP